MLLFYEIFFYELLFTSSYFFLNTDTDDCSGPNEANTYHYYRDDPWCRRYYQCGAPGQGIARPDRSCDPGQLVNLQDGSCQDAAGFECYVGKGVIQGGERIESIEEDGKTC